MSSCKSINIALRRKILADILSELSEEERIALLKQPSSDVGFIELRDLLHKQEDTLSKISKRGWFWDFSSNIAGNAAYNVGTFLLKRVVSMLVK